MHWHNLPGRTDDDSPHQEPTKMVLNHGHLQVPHYGAPSCRSDREMSG